ncbi:MAG: 2-polyprenyl-6-methoxyphenol hydroxylase-like FAD-dependent oxidoreductase [Cryomorphaceae bacterium]|jgi:2-polyprenyl-6-methoxyphenol hydroxylase-like FAD-dependent oxidoreductase
MGEPIVIMGAGWAGMAAAKLLTGQGRKVVLIDQSFD